MSDYRGAISQRDALLENFAAELTNVVYYVVLRHELGGSWLELQLGLWKVLAESVRRWDLEPSPAGSPEAFSAWRDGLLVDLTEGAFHIAMKHGIKGLPLEVELDLYRAFRLVIRRRCRAR